MTKRPCIRRNSQALVTELPDELIILLPESGKLCSLNTTGAFLWRMLDCDRGTLEVGLSRQFSIPADEASRHVCDFLTELSARGLIQVGDPGDNT